PSPPFPYTPLFRSGRRHMVDAPAAPRRLAAGRCGADGWPVAPTASRPVLSRRVDQSSPSGGFPDRPEPIGIGAGVGESVDLADGAAGDYLPSAGFVLVFVPAGREAVGDSPLPFVGASSEKIPIQPIATVRAVDSCDPCTAAVRRHELGGRGRSRLGSGRPSGGGGHGATSSCGWPGQAPSA